MGSIPELWQGQVWGTLALVVATMAMVALLQNVWGMVNKHCGYLKAAACHRAAGLEGAPIKPLCGECSRGVGVL